MKLIFNFNTGFILNIQLMAQPSSVIISDINFLDRHEIVPSHKLELTNWNPWNSTLPLMQAMETDWLVVLYFCSLVSLFTLFCIEIMEPKQKFHFPKQEKEKDGQR